MTSADFSMIGQRFYHGQRGLTIVEEYVGHGPDDPSGYDYKFDDETITHWISAGALPIRFTKEPTDA